MNIQERVNYYIKDLKKHTWYIEHNEDTTICYYNKDNLIKQEYISSKLAYIQGW
jgi:hypothetical protein